MKFKELVQSRIFWRSLLWMFLISIGFVLIIILCLRFYTRHGQEILVPDFYGKQIEELAELQNEYGFAFEVIDSIFDPNLAAGAIVRQDPKPNAIVKKGRAFYVTIATAQREQTEMPNLIDLSLRQAVRRLEAHGLILGTITYHRDFSKNAVLGQLRRGVEVAPGSRIPKGSVIDLIVSGEPENEDPYGYIIDSLNVNAYEEPIEP